MTETIMSSSILVLSDIDDISLNVCIKKEYEAHLCTSYLFLESAASTAEATGTTTAWASATRTASRTSRATTAEEGILTASEEVQTVDDMHHAVAGDGVVFGIGAPHRRDGAADASL